MILETDLYIIIFLLQFFGAMINDLSYILLCQYGLFMSVEADIRKEMIEIRERITRLETRVDELNKRLDRLSNYAKELYNYLQKQHGKTLF